MNPKKIHLQPIQDGEPAPDAWFAAQAQQLLVRILADKPSAITFLWETPEHIRRGSVPRSDALVLGMVDMTHADLHDNTED